MAKGDLVYFLDGDDWLLSNALHDNIQAFIKHEGKRYIYSNYISVDRKGKVKRERLKPYDQDNWHGQHAVNMLMWKSDALGVQGFDEDLPGWEDWDFPIKCAINGICGELLPVETFVYRNFSGKRRDLAATEMSNLLPILKERYQEYYTGAKKMACGCRGNGADVLIKAKKASSAWMQLPVSSPTQKESNGMTRMVFIGSRPGSKTYERVGGKLLQRKYRGGNNAVGRHIDADPLDVDLMASTGEWKVEDRPVSVESGNLPAPVEINYETISQEVARTIEPIPPLPSPELGSVQAAEVAIYATKKAVTLAESMNVDMTIVTGTGRNGIITVRDVRNAEPRS